MGYYYQDFDLEVVGNPPADWEVHPLLDSEVSNDESFSPPNSDKIWGSARQQGFNLPFVWTDERIKMRFWVPLDFSNYIDIIVFDDSILFSAGDDWSIVDPNIKFGICFREVGSIYECDGNVRFDTGHTFTPETFLDIEMWIVAGTYFIEVNGVLVTSGSSPGGGSEIGGLYIDNQGDGPGNEMFLDNFQIGEAPPPDPLVIKNAILKSCALKT